MTGQSPNDGCDNARGQIMSAITPQPERAFLSEKLSSGIFKKSMILLKMVPPPRLERGTPGSTNQCSNQLS